MVFYPKYPKEMYDFIKDSDLKGKCLEKEIENRFGFKLSRTYIYKLIRHHREGQKYAHGKSTLSWFTKPLGSERLDKDGYIKVRVKDGEKLKHRLVWEKEKGKIGSDEVLMFLDGDKKNCSIYNLIKVKKKYTGCINQYLHGVEATPEIRKSAIIAATLAVEAREKEIKLRIGKKTSRPKKNEWRDIVDLHNQGKNASEISEITGKKKGVIYWTVRRYKLGVYDEIM